MTNEQDARLRAVVEELVRSLEIKPMPFGAKDTLCLYWGSPGAQYGICVENNSYDAAAINWFGGLLNAAREALAVQEGMADSQNVSREGLKR